MDHLRRSLSFQFGFLLVALYSPGVRCLRDAQEPRGFESQQTAASSLVPQLGDVSDTKAEASAFLGAGAGAVQAHSKYFQDFFTVQLSPHKLEYGHTCENPDDWEQRYERKDLKNHRDQGKVRWGDKHGGYGEHYWDFNHAGHGGDDSHDEGSEQVNDYEQLSESPSREKRQPKQPAEERERTRREQSREAAQPEQPAEIPKRPKWQPSENTKRTKWQPEQSPEVPYRNKRQHKERQKIPLLIYDHSTGQVKDQVTGKVFNLQPVSQ